MAISTVKLGGTPFANIQIMNDNFAFIDLNKADKANVLAKDNVSAFTPSSDYHPATKKYVDDKTSPIQAQLDGKLKLLSPTPTGGGQVLVTDGANADKITVAKDTANTPIVIGASSFAAVPNSNTLATENAVKVYIESILAANDAMHYLGTIAGGNTGAYGALTPIANSGDTYKICANGKINGISVKVGNVLICKIDNTAAATSENYSTIMVNWNVIAVNEGVVFGPTTSTDGHVVLFGGATGKEIKDSGFTIGKSVPADALFSDTTVADLPNSAGKVVTGFSGGTLAQVTDGSDILLAGFTKTADSGDITATDSIEKAFSKIENRIDTFSNTVKVDFNATTGWSSTATNGAYTLTLSITAGKYPTVVFRQNSVATTTFDQVQVGIALVSGNQIQITSFDRFSGYVILV
ncbi:MAG: hypothetical protein RR365_00885 [Bacteroides sp.]